MLNLHNVIYQLYLNKFGVKKILIVPPDGVSVVICKCFHYTVFVFVCFLGPHPWHMDVPRLGVKLELQLLAYTTATAPQDLSHIFNLHHNPWQRRILNPLHQDGDGTSNATETSQIINPLHHSRSSKSF